MKFWTESGSAYEVEGNRIRRLNEHYEKRADGDWVLLLDSRIEVGERAILVLESLSPYGPDDHGYTGSVTTRTTSIVTRRDTK